ncbi:ADP-ribosylglycohydrolase family protein [Myroides phaeus]|uniref:ADP-ribosylglycohydrolase family protein n=1 Tax=Myroides phaeus TaxID=702745 RepID=UPI002DBEF12C|nr:ADP-ribosylglycohydrolase family protein [Myroides phaeus]MEC4117535.1 ADP-ribosylglycohydrolase family protein [Myroides phaeus]
MPHLAQDLLFGVAVADALGVPVEFCYPNEINMSSVQSNYQDIPNRQTAFGSWNKPIGTFSDDSSLTFCTAEYLANNETNLDDLLERFKDWMKEGYWTADGETFDIGRTTLFAIENYAYGSNWQNCGMKNENDNGNGSLMRISPLLLPLLYDKTITDPYSYISNFSSLTHAHTISVDCCYIYLQFAKHLYHTKNTKLAFTYLKEELSLKFVNNDIFKRLFSDEFLSTDPALFNNRGFVLGSLEIALHTILTTKSYEEAVLKAISLGKDTDTNAAITGALAGLLYGYDNIPTHWLAPLKRKENIELLAEQLHQTYKK